VPDKPAVIFAVFQTGSRSNGGVASIREVMTRLTQVRPIALTQRESEVTAAWREAGVETHVWPVSGAMSGELHHGVGRPPLPTWLLNMARFNLRTFALVRRSRAIAVHANDPAAFWHVALGARLAGARLVMNIRDTMEAPLSGMRLVKWRVIHALSQSVIVLSKDMAERWRRDLRLPAGQAGKFAVAYSLVDLQRFSPASAERRRAARAAADVGDSETLLVYIAALNPKKAQAEFLKGAAVALRAEPNLRLVFVGDFDPAVNSYAAECARSVEQERLGAIVRFAGPTRTIEDWYAAADAVVLGSRYEGLARCMIEAMACGVPVASFDVSSAREMLEERGAGAVVPAGDHEGLLAAALRLARDPASRARASAAGMAAAAELFIDRQSVAVYEGAYTDAALAGR